MTILDVIYVNYNSTRCLIDSVDTLLKQDRAKHRLNIVVIDNSSEDNILRFKDHFPEIRLILNKNNVGFGSAINQSLTYCFSKYIILLNPDTLMTDGFIEASIHFMDQNDHIGIMGPMIFDEDGGVQGSARSFPTILTSLFGRNSPITKIFPNNSITRANILTNQSDGRTPIEVDWVSGACMVVRREAMLAVGGFDERFFLYWEDTDLCKRIRDAGWKVIYFPAAKVIHSVGKSSNTRPIFANYQFHKSCYRLYEKYAKGPLSIFTPLAGMALMYRFLIAVTFNYLNGTVNGIKNRKKRRNFHSNKHNINSHKREAVLHIITRLIVGGAQENTLYTSELLDNQRYEVDVLSGPQTGTEGSLIENGIERGVHIKIESNLVREIHPLKDILAFCKILKYLKKNRYQIVHTHSSKAGIIGRWAAWVAGVPTIIHTVHGWGFHDYQHPFIRLLFIFVEKLSCHITSQLIAVSLKDIEKGIQAGIGKQKDYTLIRSGIDLHRFTLINGKKDLMRKELALPTDAKVIGTVTRLSTQKAPQVFIDSAAMILEACPDVHFVIVGDGPLRTALEKRGKALGIGHRIVFTGIRNDVHDVMQAFDLFMLTSLWEGLPRVIPQAMASGVPVIASRVDGNSEIIKNHENGVLVEPEAAKEFSKAAIDLINNETDARKLKNHALEGIDEYSVQVMVRKIDELYRSL